MQVIWDPEDGTDKQTWQFDPGDVDFKQAKKIEGHYGGTWDQWLQGLRTGELNARGVLLWHMLCHVHPSLQFKDLPSFRVRQLKVEMGVAELKDLWEKAKRIRLSDEQREAFEAAFEADMRDAMTREGIDGHVAIMDGQLAIEGADDLPKPA